ncbi:Y-family DNA polymerase [Imhoffiella purpurea]|uniref:Error-prone, lesion bypass DNA polymerase V (UmuC) n=1 Tax=Imhoffiella purpurea TaxID=1249627 RepID=W9VBY2_9GAMM|nr:Y-family DNA polymerase [Imhoffiella purpurea]EXJ16934.1 Error-prone, lesion bypass DNA polymerase V (UmuC) [Imhoffiella purpurea]
MLALADCNNFYASCERLFRPDLEGQAILVLSNNDGCVIARSNEAKALGIAMGTPFFKLAPALRRQVVVFSSNYALYGDLSRRVMQVLAGFAPRIEVDSIDECFLDLEGSADPTAECLGIVRILRQWTGIPVSIGIASTKTLAKLANRLAKQGRSPDGPVLDWSRLTDPESHLAATPVEDLWGISQRWGQRLRALGIAEALALREADPKWLRQHLGVVVERLVWELRGQSCLALEEMAPPRRQVRVSRSFGAAVTQWVELRAALTRFATRAGEKLRAQGLAAPALTVFIQTDPFDTSRPFYSNAHTSAFDQPTSDSAVLIHHATQGAKRLWRRGDAYRKAGVLLPDLVPARLGPGDFFADPAEAERGARRMAVLDDINRRFGRDSLRFGGEFVGTTWHRRARLTSSVSTTRWEALPVVRAR